MERVCYLRSPCDASLSVTSGKYNPAAELSPPDQMPQHGAVTGMLPLELLSTFKGLLGFCLTGAGNNKYFSGESMRSERASFSVV